MAHSLKNYFSSLLVTCRLPAADSENQYITFPFSADCGSSTEPGDTVDSGALQQLLNKYLLKVPWIKTPPSTESLSADGLDISE